MEGSSSLEAPGAQNEANVSGLVDVTQQSQRRCVLVLKSSESMKMKIQVSNDAWSPLLLDCIKTNRASNIAGTIVGISAASLFEILRGIQGIPIYVLSCKKRMMFISVRAGEFEQCQILL